MQSEKNELSEEDQQVLNQEMAQLANSIDDPVNTVGKIIRKNREKKGISRTALARILNISPNSLVKYEIAGEEGGQYPSLVNLGKICKFLEIDPRWVFEMLVRNNELDGTPGLKSFYWHFYLKSSENFQKDVKADIMYQEHLIGDLHQKTKKMEEDIQVILKILKENGPNR